MEKHSLVLEKEVKYIEKWFVLAFLIGIVSGLGAIIFSTMTSYIDVFFLQNIAGYVAPEPGIEEQSHIIPEERLLLALMPIIGGIVSGLLVFKFAPEAEGHGTDAVINSYHFHEGFIRKRVPLIKMIASAFTIGTGGSAGKEGPVAQIGGGFGSLIASLLKLDSKERRVAVAAGLGSGIGAMFKAPIGGAVFASEVLYLVDYETYILPPTFIASFISYIIVCFFFGWSPIFWSPSFSGKEYSLYSLPTIAAFISLGVIDGMFGIFYIKTFYKTRDYFKKIKNIPDYLKPAVGAMLTGIMGAFVPHVLGSGYGWIQYMIKENLVFLPVTILVVLPFLKVLATSFSVASGGSGGVFAPSLTIGGTLGILMWLLLKHLIPGYDVPAASFIIVGMMSFFAGVGKVPLATMLMISEMTGTYELLPPSLIAISLSYVLTGTHTIYESQVYNREESPAHGERKIGHIMLIYEKLSRKHPRVLRERRARELMTRPKAKVLCSEPAVNVVKLAKKHHYRIYPVVDEKNKFIGFISVDDVLLSGDRGLYMDVCYHYIYKGISVREEDSFEEVLSTMIEYESDKVAVTSEGGELRGIITFKEILEFIIREEVHI